MKKLVARHIYQAGVVCNFKIPSFSTYFFAKCRRWGLYCHHFESIYSKELNGIAAAEIVSVKVCRIDDG
jgi:hypothetical protein